MTDAEQLQALVTAVAAAPKYTAVSRELIQRIGAAELAKRRSLKQAIKTTKNKLHQVGGAYFAAKLDYAAALADLQAAQGDDARMRQTCRELMAAHASTRERLPILDTFYAAVFAHLPPLRHIVDVACGLNPLSLPWMPLAPSLVYEAYDIYGDLMHFLQQYFALMGVDGRAHHQDVLQQPPTATADLALVLKTLPCLEQQQKGAAMALLEALNARYLLISYPAQSLGGHGKGMVPHYEAQFQQLIDGRGWRSQRLQFAGELAFLVRKEG